MNHTPLHDGWTLRGIGDDDLPRAVRGSVPGCVHTDLLAAGLIDDPFLDDNELALAWIGHSTWEYETTFEWQPGRRPATGPGVRRPRHRRGHHDQ